MDYLNDIEKAEIQKFIANLTMKEAVRKVLLSGVYFDGVLTPGKPADPLKNFILGTMTTQTAQLLSQAERGAKIDSIINAVSLVESGFRELEKLKEVREPEPSKKNPAR